MDKTEPTRWYNNQILHIIVLVFISSLILFPKIVNTPLNDWDEARYATSALEMVHSGDWVTVTYNHVPDLANTKFPLGTWLIAIDYKLFGVNEFAVRLWSVIFTILTTVLVYILGSLIRDRWAGIISALVFITSIQVVIGHAGTTGDFDAGATFFLTLALLLFFLYYKKRKNKDLFYGMMAVAVGTMYKSFVPGFIPLVIFFLFLLFSKQLNEFINSKTIFRCVLIIIAIITPWLIARSLSDTSFVSELLGIDYWQRLTAPAPGAPYQFWFYLIQIIQSFSPWIYILPFGLFVVFRNYIKDKNKDYLFLLVWFFTVFLMFSFASTKNFWYILPLFPVMAIMIGIFWSTIMDAISKLKERKTLSVLVVIFLIIGTVLAIFNTQYFFNLRKNYNNFSTFINQDSVQKKLLSSDVLVHEDVATQSNIFYLDRLIYNRFTVSSIISCNLKPNQIWLLSADTNFLNLYLKNCPQRQVFSHYVAGDTDLFYYLIK